MLFKLDYIFMVPFIVVTNIPIQNIKTRSLNIIIAAMLRSK